MLVQTNSEHRANPHLANCLFLREILRITPGIRRFRPFPGKACRRGTAILAVGQGEGVPWVELINNRDYHLDNRVNN